jgi:hypothetical protein
MAAAPGSFDAYVDENEIADEDLAQGFRDWFAKTPATRKPTEGGGPDDTSEQDENAEP